METLAVICLGICLFILVFYFAKSMQEYKDDVPRHKDYDNGLFNVRDYDFNKNHDVDTVGKCPNCGVEFHIHKT